MPLDQEQTRTVQSHRKPKHRSLRIRERWNLTRQTLIVVTAVAAAVVVGVAGVAIKETPDRADAATSLVPNGWKMTFNSDFSGTKIDSKIWSTCYWWASGNGCTNNPTVEDEWYLSSQVKLSDGVLQLVAQPEATQGETNHGTSREYFCRSGMVTTEPGFNFTYGLVQIVGRIPYGVGLWPALWLGATNHQWPPELDILEHWGSDQKAKVYDHPIGARAFGGPVDTPGNLSVGWHTFSLLWSRNSVNWYIDGLKVYSTKSGIPHQAMTFIADLADYSSAPGACEGTLEIQSVKVWQP